VARTPRLRSAGSRHPPTPRSAWADARFAYQPHRPEETTLHRVVQEALETCLAHVGAHTGAGLPQFVKDEFEAYLECGILALGFLRVRCAQCAREKLVAFWSTAQTIGAAAWLARRSRRPRRPQWYPGW